MDTSRDSVDKKVSRDFTTESRDRLKEGKKFFFLSPYQFFLNPLLSLESRSHSFFAGIFFLYFVKKRGYRPFEIPRLSSRVKKCTERKRHHSRKKSKVPTWQKKGKCKKIFTRLWGELRTASFFLLLLNSSYVWWYIYDKCPTINLEFF